MPFKDLFSSKIKNLKFSNIKERIFVIWMKDYSVFFILFFLLIVGISAYFWYQSFYNSEWTADKKNQFMTSQEQKVNLKEGDFKKVVDEINRRSEKFKSDYQPVKDIFKPY